MASKRECAPLFEAALACLQVATKEEHGDDCWAICSAEVTALYGCALNSFHGQE